MDINSNKKSDLWLCAHYPIAKETLGSAAYDLRSEIDIAITPGKIFKIPTGLKCAIPRSYAGIIAGRSGLAAKYGVNIHAGVIDSDYRGEICVLMSSLEPFQIAKGERIAQILFHKLYEFDPIIVSDEKDLPASITKHIGFGSTGM